MTALRVRIGNFVFIGDAGRRTEAVRWVIGPDGFSGWEDGTTVRRQETDIPQHHGAFYAAGFAAPRVIVLSGNCVTASPEKLVWADRALTGLLADGSSDTLVVERDGLSTWANVGLAPSAKTQFTTRGFARKTATFQIQFWAWDPHIFGETRTFAGGSGVYHVGTVSAAPVYTVTGSMPSGYTVNGPSGSKFTVTQALTSGHKHTIDMRDGLLRKDGVVQLGAVTRADVWGIPAGATVSAKLDPVSGSGSLSASVTDTYL